MKKSALQLSRTYVAQHADVKWFSVSVWFFLFLYRTHIDNSIFMLKCTSCIKIRYNNNNDDVNNNNNNNNNFLLGKVENGSLAQRPI